MKKIEENKKLEYIDEEILDEIASFATLYNRIVNKSETRYYAPSYISEEGEPIYFEEIQEKEVKQEYRIDDDEIEETYNKTIIRKYRVDDYEVKNNELLTFATRKTLTEKKGASYIKSLKKYLLAQTSEIIADAWNTLECHKKSEEEKKERKQQCFGNGEIYDIDKIETIV